MNRDIFKRLLAKRTPFLFNREKPLRVLSLLILFVFLSNQTGWSNLVIPPELGRVTQEYNPSVSDQLPKVIHIQTVHMNYQVQKNIEKILEHLKNEANVDLVALEGADVPIDPDRIFHIDDAQTRYRIADNLAKDGQITGSELFAIKSVQDIRDRKLRIEGVENRKLYQQNLSDLRYVISNRESMLEHLNKLRKRAESLEPLILPREVQQILQHKRQFETQSEDLPKFFHFLDEKAVRMGIESTSEKYPALAKFFILENVAKFIEKNELAVLEEWKSLKTERALSESESISSYLPSHEVDRFVFPRLGAYKSYLELMGEAHEFSNLAMEEAERLENEILYTLILKKQELELVELAKDLSDIKQLFDVTLVRDRLGRIEKRAAGLSYKQLLDRLETMEASLARPVDSRLDTADQEKFDTLIGRSISFYKLAKERDTVMMNRFADLLKDSERAVIITGGFHSDGITQLLRQRGISYGVILPDVREISDHNAYLNALSIAKAHDINSSTETSHLELALTFGNAGLDPSSIALKLLNLFAAEAGTGQPIHLNPTNLGPLPEGISDITSLQENAGGFPLTRFVVTRINESPLGFTWSNEGLTLAGTTLSPKTVASIISENIGLAKEIDFGLIAPKDSPLALALKAMIWVISAETATGEAETVSEFVVSPVEPTLSPTMTTTVTTGLDVTPAPETAQPNPLFEFNPRLAATVTLLNNEGADETTVDGVIQTYLNSGGVATFLSAEALTYYVPVHEIPAASDDFAVPSRFGVLPMLELGAPIIEKALRQKAGPEAKIGTFKLVSNREFSGFGIETTARLLGVEGRNFHVEKESDGFFTVTGTPNSLLELRTRTKAGAKGIADGIRAATERLQSGLPQNSSVSFLPENVRFADISALMETGLAQAGALPANNFFSQTQKGSENNFAVKVVTDLSEENFSQLELDIRENPSSVYVYLDYELRSDSAGFGYALEMAVKYENFFHLRVDDGRRNVSGASEYLSEFFTQSLFTHTHKAKELELIGKLLKRSGYGEFSNVLTDTFVVASPELVSALNQRELMKEAAKLILDSAGRSDEELIALHFVGLHVARVGFAVALDRNWLDPTEDAIRYKTYRPIPSMIANLSALYASFDAALKAISVSA